MVPSSQHAQRWEAAALALSERAAQEAKRNSTVEVIWKAAMEAKRNWNVEQVKKALLEIETGRHEAITAELTKFLSSTDEWPAARALLTVADKFVIITTRRDDDPCFVLGKEGFLCIPSQRTCLSLSPSDMAKLLAQLNFKPDEVMSLIRSGLDEIATSALTSQ